MKLYARQAAVTKAPTGIQGFDEITGGGLPCGRTTLVMGGPGCGKTVFALQALVNGAHQRRKPASSSPSRRARARSSPTPPRSAGIFPALEKKKLFFLDAQLSPEVVKAGEFDLDRHARRSLQAKAEGDCMRRASSSTGSTCCSAFSMTRPRSGARSTASATGSRRTGLTGIITQKVGGDDATSATASCSSWSIASSCSGIRSSTDRRSATCAS